LKFRHLQGSDSRGGAEPDADNPAPRAAKFLFEVPDALHVL
jgi:hypothetical protein